MHWSILIENLLQYTLYFTPYRRTEIDLAFRQFDSGNKGYITIDDAKVIMRRFGLSDPEIESLVMFHDANRDGKLQYSEFKQFWSARSGLMGQLIAGAAPAPAPALAPAPQAPRTRPVPQPSANQRYV